MSVLYHFSEDPSITVFSPRPHPSHPSLAPAVWAIDEKRAPLYYFPRDCPRIAFYPQPKTSAEDLRRYHEQTQARMVIAVESNWYFAIRETVLYRYSFAADPFHCWDGQAGYFIAHSPVAALDIQPMGDLLDRLTAANVELRFTPSLAPLRDHLLSTTLHFSMIRMRNANL